MSHELTNPAEIRRFALAGRAHLTLTSLVSGVHFTYRVSQAADKETGDLTQLWFVSLLRDGSADDGQFTYLGIVGKDGLFRTTKGTKVSPDAPSLKAFSFFWAGLVDNRVSPQLRVQHEGRCGRCGRTLTEPLSITTGLGPICREEMGIVDPPSVKEMVEGWLP